CGSTQTVSRRPWATRRRESPRWGRRRTPCAKARPSPWLQLPWLRRLPIQRPAALSRRATRRRAGQSRPQRRARNAGGQNLWGGCPKKGRSWFAPGNYASRSLERGGLDDTRNQDRRATISRIQPLDEVVYRVNIVI